MSLAPPSPSFFRRLLTRRARRELDDPADMGTAFGLEASIGPASGLMVESDLANAPAGAPLDDSPMGWLTRLSPRRR